MKFIYSVISAVALITSTQAIADPFQIEDLREGDMRRLVVHSDPKPVTDREFELENFGGSGRLSDYNGKFVLLNIWAPWCGPCRVEMPMLSSLQAELGGSDFEVVTISTGTSDPYEIKNFFNQIGVGNLPEHRDPTKMLSSGLGAFGIPLTIIIDRDGNEVARMRGEANWNSESSRSILRKVMSAP